MNKTFTDEHLKAVRGIIGAQLRRRREEKGITQTQMAELMGVAYPTITKIELGRWNFSLDYLLQYCHHLDLFFFIAEKDAKDPLIDLMLDAMNMKKNQDT
jgi:transcriptional regulator with XRE-family HTH domain